MRRQVSDLDCMTSDSVLASASSQATISNAITAYTMTSAVTSAASHGHHTTTYFSIQRYCTRSVVYAMGLHVDPHF